MNYNTFYSSLPPSACIFHALIVIDGCLLQRGVETKHALFSNLHLALFAWNWDWGRRVPATQKPTAAVWASLLV